MLLYSKGHSAALWVFKFIHGKLVVKITAKTRWAADRKFYHREFIWDITSHPLFWQRWHADNDTTGVVMSVLLREDCVVLNSPHLFNTSTTLPQVHHSTATMPPQHLHHTSTTAPHLHNTATMLQHHYTATTPPPHLHKTAITPPPHIHKTSTTHCPWLQKSQKPCNRLLKGE